MADVLNYSCDNPDHPFSTPSRADWLAHFKEYPHGNTGGNTCNLCGIKFADAPYEGKFDFNIVGIPYICNACKSSVGGSSP